MDLFSEAVEKFPKQASEEFKNESVEDFLEKTLEIFLVEFRSSYFPEGFAISIFRAICGWFPE